MNITLLELPFVEGDRLSYTHKDLNFSLITDEVILKARGGRSHRIESKIAAFGELSAVRWAGQQIPLEHKRDHPPGVFLVIYVNLSKPA